MFPCPTIGTHTEVGGNRAVRDDEVEPVDREIGQEAIRTVLAANEPHRLGQAKGRLHQFARDEFRDRVGTAASERQRRGELAVPHEFQQLIPGQLQVPPGSPEELHAQRCGERRQLPRDRMRGQVQLPPGFATIQK